MRVKSKRCVAGLWLDQLLASMISRDDAAIGSTRKRFSETIPLEALKRPSKLELGASSFVTGFGGSLPRVLMPASITASSGDLAELQKFRAIQLRHASQASEIEELTRDALRLHLSNEQRRLDERSRTAKRAFLAARRLEAAAQDGYRPSDRLTDIRGYSSFDKDVWRFRSLRGWYNRPPQSQHKAPCREAGALRASRMSHLGQSAQTLLCPRDDGAAALSIVHGGNRTGAAQQRDQGEECIA